MLERNANMERMTRRELREGFRNQRFKAAIIASGSIEQHLEHLEIDYDISAATWVSEQSALQLYPHVLVTAPVRMGISEHHMEHGGTISSKPGSWLSIVFDAVESLARLGIHNILILNGHGGNEAPVYGVLRQWQLYFGATSPEVNLQFHSYWNLSRYDAEQIVQSSVPGHATEYETSMAMALFPEKVREESMKAQRDDGIDRATKEKGFALADAAVLRTTEYVEGMINGSHKGMMPQLRSWQLDPRNHEAT